MQERYEILINKNYVKEEKRQVLIEFNLKNEDSIIKSIIDNVLKFHDSKVTFCKVNFDILYDMSKDISNIRVINKKFQFSAENTETPIWKKSPKIIKKPKDQSFQYKTPNKNIPKCKVH